MNLSHLNIGILHSLVGKNDGVSIVIDQSVDAMVNDLKIPLGNIYFLAAHSSPRFNVETDEVFWHKNDINKKIVAYFSRRSPHHLEALIEKHAEYASRRLEKFIETNNIDLLVAHNTSHPYNFITAVGLGRYLERRRQAGFAWPKVLVWWHDSYFERPNFAHPNDTVRKYLKYLPGTMIDGVVFINRDQEKLAAGYYAEYQAPKPDFFTNYTDVIPNTCRVDWPWRAGNWEGNQLNAPPVDPYNKNFFRDIGLDKMLRECGGKSVNDAILLLQHTRIVPRKKIETAIDFAFMLSRRSGPTRPVALIVSGYSGDEQNDYKNFLKDYYRQRQAECSPEDGKVVLCFAENRVLSYRDVIIDRKFYRFNEIPAIVAANGGLGVYFSEIEGFGNNLLEMVGNGLPVVVNRYKIYREEIEPLGFDLPAIDGKLNETVVDQACRLLNDRKYRNAVVSHNLNVLEEKLNHRIMATKLQKLFENIFFRI